MTAATIIQHPLTARLEELVDDALVRRHLLLARHTPLGWVVVVDDRVPAHARHLLQRHPNVAGPLIARAKGLIACAGT